MLRRIREEDPPTPSARWTQLNAQRTTELAAMRRTSPGALRDELRGDLDRIVVKAMEKERERRYPSAARLADDVERYLRGEPTAAGPPSAAYRLRKYARKHRTLLGATSAVILALFLGLAVSIAFAVMAAESERHAIEGQEAARKSEAEKAAQLAQILRLSDLQDLDTLRAESDALWPASSANVAGLEAWLERARPLAARIEGHRETLKRLRAEKALPYGEDDARRDRETHPRAGELEEMRERLGLVLPTEAQWMILSF